MAIKIYAGTTSAELATALPSPVELRKSEEQIWSENTGRTVSSGAAMVGDSVAEKRTYSISWGIISQSELDQIRTRMKRGFFTFKVVRGGVTEQFSAYRSNIETEFLGEYGGVAYYKSASTEVVEQ